MVLGFAHVGGSLRDVPDSGDPAPKDAEAAPEVQNLRPRYASVMLAPGNLADPDFEPSDDDLMGLSKRAFSGVREQRERALDKLRAEIDTARAEILRQFAPATR